MQSFRAASIVRTKALHYRFNKDVLHDKNENSFLLSVVYTDDKLIGALKNKGDFYR